MLRLGAKGIEVRQLQQLLNARGARPQLVEDGDFGPMTEAAVLTFQRRVGLVADGIAGPKTLAALNSGYKLPKLLGDADLQRAAQLLDVDLAAIRAVNEVESRGNGFLMDGRPVILFERHVMYNRLEENGIDPEPHAERMPNIVNRQRGGYLGGAAEHGRLKQARSIAATCAIESASWGLFQIMGYHWPALGYASAAGFMVRMHDSEAAQLDAFVRFILLDKDLHRALKARKWAQFARLYNGPAYKANLYDIKLARAYERHSELEDAAHA